MTQTVRTRLDSTESSITTINAKVAVLDDPEGIGAVQASASEIDRVAHLSSRLVNLVGSVALTRFDHEGRDLYITGATSASYLLPASTGSGSRFRFIIGEVNTNNTVIVVADTATTNFVGSVNILDRDASAQSAFGTPANCDTITLNGTTTGGQLGDFIELIDVAQDVWMVTGQLQCPVGSNPATCFSAAL